MKIRFTLLARQDLADIHDYLAEKSPTSAQRVEDHLRSCIGILEQWPGIGTPTDLQDVRRLPAIKYPYTVFYRVEDQTQEIHVLRFVHGARVKDLKRVP